MHTSKACRHITFHRVFGFLLVTPLLLLSLALRAKANVIVVSTTIQAAIDAAVPGDTVRVPPGIYRENVLVAKDNLTIKGSHGAILDGAGLPGTSGITVRSSIVSGRINGFRLTGMQIQNFSRNGVFLVRVDNFQIDSGNYVNNAAYGLFPVLSSRGLIESNQVSGSDDTGIYIGQSRDAVIKDNHVSDCTVGIDVELSSNIIVRDNKVLGNTVGMTTEVLPGRAVTVDANIQIIRNVFSLNNRPNPVTNPTEFLSQLPSGAGLLIIGADSVMSKQNIVIQNKSVGIALLRLPQALAALDPRVNPFPDNNKILENIVLLNGSNPDPRITVLPPGDLIWDFSGTANCWDDNVFRTSFPLSLPDCP